MQSVLQICQKIMCSSIGKDKEVYGLTGFDLEELEYGTDLDCAVQLEDTSDDAPKYTYVTGTHPIVTTSTAPVCGYD